MGQQQILLIVLSVILVGVAVAIGISMFRDNALSSNRDAIMSDLSNYASKAQAYRMKPANMGGGAGAYTGMPLSALATPNAGGTAIENENASYAVTVDNADQITIVATGTVGGTPWILTYVIDDAGDAAVTETQVATF